MRHIILILMSLFMFAGLLTGTATADSWWQPDKTTTFLLPDTPRGYWVYEACFGAPAQKQECGRHSLHRGKKYVSSAPSLVTDPKGNSSSCFFAEFCRWPYLGKKKDCPESTVKVRMFRKYSRYLDINEDEKKRESIYKMTDHVCVPKGAFR